MTKNKSSRTFNLVILAFYLALVGLWQLVFSLGLVHDYLFARCLTIGGGTSEIMRNTIAERILGLPRDPLVK